MGSVLCAVCNRSGAEVVCKGGMFEMHGLESEVCAAVAMVLELEIIKVSHNFSRVTSRSNQVSLVHWPGIPN